jgi:hypothetical protein
MSAAEHISQFFTAWGESDADVRNAALSPTLASEIFYVDPRTEAPVTTADALKEYVGMYSQFAPGATAGVVSLSECQGFHRATVEFGMPDGNKQHGQYFVETNDAGQLTRLIGFVGMGAPE